MTRTVATSTASDTTALLAAYARQGVVVVSVTACTSGECHSYLTIRV